MLFLAIALVNSLYNTGTTIFEQIHRLSNKIIYPIAFTVFMIFLFLVVRGVIKIFTNHKLKLHHFVGLFVLIFLIGFLNIITSDITLLYDPEKYFSSGLLISQDFQNFNLNNIYHRRSVFYTFPILNVFPEVLSSVQFVNLLLHLSSVLIFTYIIYQEYGKQLAFYFMLFYGISFEFYATITIASHDLASIFYFSLLCLGTHVLFRKPPKYSRFLLISSIVILIVINDFQRGIKMPLLISLIFLTLITYKNEFSAKKYQVTRSLVVILIGSILLSYLTTTYAKKKYGERDSFFSIASMIYSYNDIDKTGDYHSGKENRYNYIAQVPDKDKSMLSIKKYVSQIANHPKDMSFLWGQKLSKLFSMTPESFFYMDAKFYVSVDKNVWLIKLGLMLISLISKIILLFFAIRGILYHIINKSFMHLTNIYIIYPFVILPLFLLTEVNATYSLILYPSLIFFAAYGALNPINSKLKDLFNYKQHLLIPTAFIIGVLFLIFILANLVVGITPGTLIDFSADRLVLLNGKELTNDAGTIVNPYELSFENLDMHPNETVLLLEQSSKMSTISFFVKTKDSAENFEMEINDNTVTPKSHKTSSYALKGKEFDENSDQYYYYSYNLPKNTKTIELKFPLINHHITLRDILVK